MTSGTPQPPDENESTPVAAPAPVPPRAAPGTGLGAVAVVLGGLGCLLPLTPFAFSDARDWIPLVFAVPGIVFGLYGCTSRNRGNMLAIVGAILCTIAIGLSTVALTKFWGNPGAPGDDTEELLRDEIDVHLGELQQNPATGIVSMSVTIYNKGSDFASYVVTFDVNDDEGACEAQAYAEDLMPGASVRDMVHTCNPGLDPEEFNAQITKVERR
ncbi:hypothetical protein [Actinophytocola sp. NPDC049390]|uniref:hypothetical protein n=1 Tax=Actinophytocola sp. NPDC049390 TaxID=3363894 RepID=UPI003787F938